MSNQVNKKKKKIVNEKRHLRLAIWLDWKQGMWSCEHKHTEKERTEYNLLLNTQLYHLIAIECSFFFFLKKVSSITNHQSLLVYCNFYFQIFKSVIFHTHSSLLFLSFHFYLEMKFPCQIVFFFLNLRSY